MRISDWSSDGCSSDLPVGDDERRIETDAKLADQLRIATFVFGHGIEKLARTRTRHGAEILDQLVAAHADTAVVDAECARRLVGEIGRASCRERVCQYV